jgi:micrococcal nuclease
VKAKSKLRKQQPSRRYPAGAFLFAALLALLSAPVVSQGDSISVQVVRVIDGNTVEVCCLSGHPEKVRYIGVNTPETNHPAKEVEAHGKEAKEENRRLVAGNVVRLKFDVQ